MATLALQASSAGPVKAAGGMPEAIWLNHFISLSRDAHTVEAPPEEVETMFGLQKAKKLGSCYSLLRLADSHPPFVTDASATLIGPTSECKSLRIGLIDFDINTEPRFVATALEQISAATRLNPSKIPAGQNIVYHWQLAPGTAIELTVYGGPAAAGQYGIAFAHVPAQLPGSPAP